MELLPLSLNNLNSRVDDGGNDIDGLALVQQIQCCISICQALIYLHTQERSPIVHGDIKPQNILLSKYMHAKLCDFGLSHIQSTANITYTQATKHNVASGTPQYLAPELINDDKPVYGTFNDVYSFAC